MAQRDARIDAYIQRAAPFAQPILERLRAVVHDACPEVEESVKWGMPSFQYGGRILCGMAAFKQHASFGFWQHAQVMETDEREGMGSLGKLASLKDLPPKRELVALVRKAMSLIDAGVKPAGARKTASPKPSVEAPDDLLKALRGNRAAKAVFEAFPPSQKREYVEWISEAKREDTRARRLAQAVEWMAEGKPRHWKYQKR